MRDLKFFNPQVAVSGYTTKSHGNISGTNTCILPHITTWVGTQKETGMTFNKRVEYSELILYRRKEELKLWNDTFKTYLSI